MTKKASSSPVLGMEQFFTRQKSNEGVVLPLSLPDGSPTEHWIRIRGVDSDEYRKADARARRKAMEIAQEKDEAKRDDMIEETKIDVLAALFVDWSFDKPCTAEHVREFLREAPQIAEVVDKSAYRRALFFGKGSGSSSSSPSTSSS